ncbi:MAG: MBL fold metallo-hydrolase [Candidatus Pacebacteria bacterium]|nr:MBL fold metallo-hydrolase [Candidatus Paceibacterota bacterium]
MTITWYGQSCFEITAKNKENSDTTIVIDPFSEETGLKMPKLAADVLLVSHGHFDHNNVKAVGGEPFLIDACGEYEVKDAFVKGLSAFHDDKAGKERGGVIIYKIEIEDIKICHLSDLGQKELTGEQMEQIGDVDILMVPVGGKYTIDAKDASEIISQIEPRVVLPMHYALPGSKSKDDLDGVDRFLKVMGEEGVVPEKKLKITAKNLPVDETKIVILEI